MDLASRRVGDCPTCVAAAMSRAAGRRRRAIWLVATLLVSLSGCAGLAVADDRQAPEADRVIAAGTREIESGLFTGTRLAGKFAERGTWLTRKGEYDRAIQDFDQAISLDPDNGALFIRRAYAYLKKSDYDRANQDYDRAIALDPQGEHSGTTAWGPARVQYARVDLKYWAFIGRAGIYRLKGEYGRAIEDCDRAIKLGPDLPFGYVNRSLAYLGKDEFDRAIEDANQTIKIDANNASAYFSRMLAYLGKGELDRAIEDANAIKPDPADALALNTRCYRLAIVGRMQAALGDCNAALKLRPDDPQILDTRGFTYLKLGEIDRALADYDAALRNNPKNAYALFGRGMAKRMKGDSAGTDTDIAAAKAISPKVADEMRRYGVKIVDPRPVGPN